MLTDTDDRKYLEKYGIAVPVCFTDPVTLKTIMRSNPGVMELRRGVIVSKQSCFDLGRDD